MLLDELSGDDAVIDSIRTPGEVQALRTREDFVLIEVRAGVDSRWQRSQDRGRPGDPVDRATFISHEEAEEVALDDAGQALVATAEMANLVLFTDGPIDELHSDLEDLLERLA